MCNNQKTSRRNFLQLLGSTTTLPLMQSPVQILIESVLMGVSRNALAAEVGVKPRRYLNISLLGAPPRWTHDLFLTPYNATGFVTNQMVGSKYEGGSSASSVSYSTFLKKGINVPHLWQFGVPKAGGGTRPMDELLDNMLSIRGVYIGNPDHGAAQSMQFLPPGATQSISALAADASSMPISAVNASVPQYKFLSLKSKSPVTIQNNGNMLNTLLAPFIRKDVSSFQTKRQNLSAALDVSVGILNSYAESLNPRAANLTSAMNDAKDLLSTGFGDLTATWDNLVAKYTALVRAGFNPAQNLIGINDKPIPSDGTPKFAFNDYVVSMPDIRTMITSTTNVSQLIGHFAMAEYILTSDLSSSVAIAPSGIVNVSVNTDTGVRLDFDEHRIGAMFSLLGNSYFNIAYSACLLELIDQLKKKEIFDETVIVSSGEFGRNARTNGSGSDHGHIGNSAAIYTGAMKGPLVLGNIYNNKSQGSADGGTWGAAAPVAELGKSVDLSHLSATIAYLLRTASPVTAGYSLVMNSGDTLIPVIEKARQV